MSLLMQALKKAEHAKQKQGESPSSDLAEDKSPLALQQDDIALSPQETKPASPAANLDMLAMELSPATHESPPSPDTGSMGAALDQGLKDSRGEFSDAVAPQSAWTRATWPSSPRPPGRCSRTRDLRIR